MEIIKDQGLKACKLQVVLPYLQCDDRAGYESLKSRDNHPSQPSTGI